MKNLVYLLLGLFLVGGIYSCTNEMKKDSPVPKSVNKKGKQVGPIPSVTEKEQSTPISENGIVPYIIPGQNPGGNRTCDEVEEAWGKGDDYFICGEKIDYEEDEGWLGDFPDGLQVTVDDENKTLSFSMDECISIDGKSYKVGAVIVKGGNGANVYFYENGTLSDAGLGAPGGKFLVSNLTFCFVECDREWTLAVKSWYYDDSYRTYAVSKGTSYFDTGFWCDQLGIHSYPGTSYIEMINYYDGNITVGSVTIEEVNPEGVRSLKITVDLEDDLVLDHTYLYFGELTGITEGPLKPIGCPDYDNWPYQDGTNVNTHVFIIPL